MKFMLIQEVDKMARKNEQFNQQQFYITQIQTTKEIIKTFSNTNQFSPTMLINSLLSLVLLPFERAKKSNREKIFPGKCDALLKTLSISPIVFAPIKHCEGGKVSYNNKTIYEFIRKFRNGIAHQNLEVNVNEERKIFITISNKYTCKDCSKCKKCSCKDKGLQKMRNSVIDFQICVTVNELQKLALYIADSYLKAIT